MSKLECGCEVTDHRPGGEFLLFAGGVLIGRSSLEWEDAADGVWLRSGVFRPTAEYGEFQDLFQRCTRAIVSARTAPSKENERTLKMLESEIAKLPLRLMHPAGLEIRVASYELQDCADTLDEDPRELQVSIDDRSVHARFFSQAII